MRSSGVTHPLRVPVSYLFKYLSYFFKIFDHVFFLNHYISSFSCFTVFWNYRSPQAEVHCHCHYHCQTLFTSSGGASGSDSFSCNCWLRPAEVRLDLDLVFAFFHYHIGFGFVFVFVGRYEAGIVCRSKKTTKMNLPFFLLGCDNFYFSLKC